MIKSIVTKNRLFSFLQILLLFCYDFVTISSGLEKKDSLLYKLESWKNQNQSFDWIDSDL